MDGEEEPTQPCTQPWVADKQTADDTTGVLCTLFPTTPTAKATVRRLLEQNRDFVFIQRATVSITSNASIANNSDEQLDSCDALTNVNMEALSIALRFDPGPKSTRDGFCFGRNLGRCDVIMGGPHNQRRISNVHFRIFVNEHHVLMLEDSSTNGTFVDGVFLGPPDHNNHGKAPQNARPRSRQLINGSEIHFLKGPKNEEMKFMVRIPRSDGSGFMGDGDNMADYNPDNAFQKAPVAGPAAFARHMRGRQENPNAGRQNVMQASNNPKMWIGSPRFTLLEPIGQGAFATVQKAVRKADREEVAVKIIARRTFASVPDKNKAKAIGVRKEVEILEKLKHPNIVQYYECLEDDSHIYIVMEYIGGGDLGAYVQRHGRMEEPLAQEVTRQVLRGIEYVHKKGISHRDIKPDNILLVSEDPILVKISDFGLAKMVQNEETFLKTFCGTMLYLAPEVFPGYIVATLTPGSKRKHDAIDGRRKHPTRRYNQAVDMWSIGCVTYILLTGKPPFDAKTQDEMYQKIMTGKFDEDTLRMCGVDRHCYDFLKKLMNVNPALRMVEYEALVHPWLAGRDEDSSFSSSMEVDEENSSYVVPRHTQDALSPIADVEEEYIKEEDIADVKEEDIKKEADSDDERRQDDRTVRCKKDADYELSEEDSDIKTPRGTLIKKFPYGLHKVKTEEEFEIEDQEEEASFEYPTQSAGEAFRDNRLALSGDSNGATQGSSGVLGLEEYEFVSERTIDQDFESEQKILPSHPREKAPYTISSQPRDISDSREITPVASQNITALPTPFLSPPYEQYPPLPFEQHPPQSQFHLADYNSSPAPNELAATKILMSSAASSAASSGAARLDPTIFQQQMPLPIPRPLIQPAASPQLSSGDNVKKRPTVLVPQCSLEGLLDYSHQQELIPPYWGKLVPLPNSLAHPTVLLRENSTSFGRVNDCTIVYTDDRISKKHCAFVAPRQAEGSKAKQKPLAWLKCTATNPVMLNGKKVVKDFPTMINDGDEVMLFKDHSVNERLGFKIHLKAENYSYDYIDDIHLDGKGRSSPDGQPDTDHIMSG